MSDLQCPATFLVLTGTDDDGLVPALREERVAAVYAGSGMLLATAERLADRLGLAVSVDDALGGPSYPHAIETLADVHRGETVLLVPGEPAIGELRARTRMSGGPDGYEVLLAVDANGWTVRRWTSRTEDAAGAGD